MAGSQYRQYCEIAIIAYFEQVSTKSKITKQFMYNWLQLAERDTTIISIPLAMGRVLTYELPDQKI